MREFAFDIVYETGADPVMDVFIEYPTLVGEALHGCVTEDSFWRVERLTGPTAALTRVTATSAPPRPASQAPVRTPACIASKACLQ